MEVSFIATIQSNGRRIKVKSCQIRCLVYADSVIAYNRDYSSRKSEVKPFTDPPVLDIRDFYANIFNICFSLIIRKQFANESELTDGETQRS